MGVGVGPGAYWPAGVPVHAPVRFFRDDVNRKFWRRGVISPFFERDCVMFHFFARDRIGILRYTGCFFMTSPL